MLSNTWRAMWMTHGEPCGDTWQRHACVTHGMPCVNMHGSFQAYIRGFKWAVLTTKRGSKLQFMGAARRRRGNGKREREERKGEREEMKGERKKEREEERGGREEKERGKGRSVVQ